jgi:hypothetical protein
VSKENVALFLEAADKRPELLQRLATTDKTADWVEVARDAGFELTAEELRSVVETTLNKKVTTENAIPEYLASRATIGAAALTERALDSVVGGSMIHNLPPPSPRPHH